MNRNTVIGIVVLVLLVAGGVFIAQSGDGEESATPAPTQASQPTAQASAQSENSSQTVEIGSNGFSPATLTVTKGTSVTFVNKSGRSVEVASDPHPTHTNLKGFESDALRDGASFSFTFDKAGTWGYHDHLRPSMTAKVVVQ